MLDNLINSDNKTVILLWNVSVNSTSSSLTVCEELGRYDTFNFWLPICSNDKQSEFPFLLESPRIFFVKFPVLESPGKWLWSWKFKLKILEVLEFAGTRTQWCRHRCENIHVCTPLVLVICSYSDKTFSLHMTVINTAVWKLLSCCYM